MAIPQLAKTPWMLHRAAPSAMTGNAMRISFCTTCFNRASQFKQVFESNVEVLRGEESVEWLILNYNSRDDLDEYILPFVRSKACNIRYVKEISGRKWHMSLAKNISHKLASGDILMNLDCDNRIGEAVTEIRDAFTASIGALHLWSGRYGDGTCGRIAIRRELFFNVGGYDESFRPMAYQDEDLLERLRDMGETVKHRPCLPPMAIANAGSGDAAPLPKTAQWERYHKHNFRISNRNRAEGRLVANAGKLWGAGYVSAFS
jgi:predicted glycosyltransferase involved in capsule biosynthesis